MKVSKIKSTFIFEDVRLNASYFLNEDALNSMKLELNRNRCISLDQMANVWNPPIFKRQFCERTNKSIPYCQSSDVANQLEGSDVYIYKEQAIKVNSVVKENQILVTGFGTIGNTRLVNELSSGISYANNVCRIEASEKLPFGYIYAFLTSKYGRSQLNKNASGSVVRYIEAPGIKRTLIPILSAEKQQKIHQLIVEASELRVEANKLLKESQRHLLRLLNIDNECEYELTKPLERDVSNIFSTKRSALSANTLRSRNYSPRKLQIINVLKQNQYSRLKEVLSHEPFYGARYKRIESFSENSIMLLSQGDLFDRIPKGRSISKSSVKNLSEEIVSKGSILVPAQGTLGENEIFGRAVFVWGYLEDTLVAGHAMRFIPNEEKIMTGYLFAVLNSPLWFRLFRNSVYGTNLLGFIVPLINELPIPRFSNEEEGNIDVLVKTAYDNLTLANLKENQAIALIEKEIDLWQVS